MQNQELKEILMRELPGIMRRDPEIERLILDLSRRHFADRAETESRFDRILDELRRDREEQARRWEEQDRKWRENQATINAMLEEIRALARRHDSTIGALRARWGLRTEQSFIRKEA